MDSDLSGGLRYLSVTTRARGPVFAVFGHVVFIFVRGLGFRGSGYQVHSRHLFCFNLHFVQLCRTE